jgi:hypothetical protein
MNSNSRQAKWTGTLVCSVVLTLAAATVLIVLQYLGVRPRIDDAGMRALLCILLALACTRLIRAGMVRWQLEQKLGPQAVFYSSLAVAISCLL